MGVSCLDLLIMKKIPKSITYDLKIVYHLSMWFLVFHFYYIFFLSNKMNSLNYYFPESHPFQSLFRISPEMT